MNCATTHVVLILDRSGSMQAVKKQTVDGYNEQIRMLLEESSKGWEINVSLLTFNKKVTEDFFNAPVKILREMDESQYNPTGGTAMFDAIGYAINRLHEVTDTANEYNSYLVVTLSDGKENASTVWTGNKLGNKIEELQNTNRWTFSYIGANQDINLIIKELKIKPGNTLRYESNGKGTSEAFKKNASAMSMYFNKKAVSSQLKFSVDDLYMET